MKNTLSRLLAVASAALTLTLPSTLSAQGITTGAISGLVQNEASQPLANAQVQITNPATGFSGQATTRENGRYFIQGLEVGGPYTVNVRHIGMAMSTRTDVYVRLSQTTRLDWIMRTQPVALQGVLVEATRTEVFAPSNTGMKTIVSDSAIQRLPTTSRQITDFIKLTPQVSQSGPGYSGGGMSNRMNNVQIDGSSERDVFGLGTTGTPGAEVNAKGISIDAVKEYQVLLAPFDVRQGNFGGILLNAVTKSGTNDFRGSAYYFFRNERYGADTSTLTATKFDRTQWGFTVGGPIIKNKLHFFVAPEFTTQNTPVTGPYKGQPAANPFFAFDPNAAGDTTNKGPLFRFDTTMLRLANGYDLGTAGYNNIPNPLSNMFARIDWQINDVHRLAFHFNYAKGEQLRQQNFRGSTTVVYSSNFHNFVNEKVAPVAQLFSNFKNGSFNELFVGYNKWGNRRTPLTLFPQITVNNLTGNNATGTGNVTNVRIIAGADQFSQGNELDTKSWEFTDNYTRPWKTHTFTIGTRNEYVWLRNQFTQSSFGVWAFASLDSLSAGNPSTFRKATILANGGNVEFTALQSAFYAQDQWQVNPNLAITAGLRWDVSNFLDDIKYNAAIDSAYGRRTDDIPKQAVQFSPRLGFNWDITGTLTDQLRGGIGLFVGTPPYVWLENAYVNSGNIITFLNCTTAATPAPAFAVDPSGINTCRNGSGSAPIGDVNFMSKSLKFPQPLRGTLAYDRRLPGDMIFTVEGMYSKTLNQLFFKSLNTSGPQGTSQGGRVIYMNVVNGGTGAATNLLPASVTANGGLARFTTAIDLQNQSKDYSYNLTFQLRKRYADNWEGMVAYTYGKSRDVGSFSSSTAISNWQFGRTLSTAQEDPATGVSLFDQPHKLMATGTYTLNWAKVATDFSFFYSGTSGAPHDYIYAGAGGAAGGDLNGDGVSGNDLIYVPKSALDPSEVQFRATGTAPNIRTPAQQAVDLENFITNSKCLSDHRGQILPRNSCRLPFLNQVDLAIRQRLPTIRGQDVAVTLDIFNFGNLLNKNWGKFRSNPFGSNSNVPLMTHVGYNTTAGVATTNPATGIPVVTFAPLAPTEYTIANSATNFWRTQLSVRYSF